MKRCAFLIYSLCQPYAKTVAVTGISAQRMMWGIVEYLINFSHRKKFVFAVTPCRIVRLASE